MRSDRKFFIRCLLYSILSSGTMFLVAIPASLAVPIMNIFNRTSVEYLGIHDGGALLTSVSYAISSLTNILSLVLLIPLMDSKGRKFICVQMKFFATLASSVSFVAAYFLQSSVALIVGMVFIEAAFPMKMIGDPLYFAELCADRSGGYFSAAVNIIANMIAGTVMMFISKPNVFGSDEKWIVAVIIPFILNFFFYAIGRGFEETLPDEKRSSIVENLSHRVSLFKEVFTSRINGSVFVYVLLILQLPIWSSYYVETSFPIQLYQREGATADQVLSINLILFLLFVPVHWIGPILIDKFSHANFVRLAICLILLKNVIHILNFELLSEILVYANISLHNVLSAIGLNQIGFLICADSLPIKYRVIVSQMAFLASVFVQSILKISYPLVANYSLLWMIVTLSIVILLSFALEIQQRRMKPPPSEEKAPLLVRQF